MPKNDVKAFLAIILKNLKSWSVNKLCINLVVFTVVGLQ